MTLVVVAVVLGLCGQCQDQAARVLLMEQRRFHAVLEGRLEAMAVVVAAALVAYAVVVVG